MNCLVCLALAVSTLPLAALAQDIDASVSGSVTDPGGASIVSASVKLVSHATTAAERQTTNREGNFLFNAVKPGFYSLTVELRGFRKFEHAHFEVARNKSATYSTSGAQTNGLFGEYTAAANPRQLQLALRLTF